jgi:diaminohydroxyphosphoribosylaminopyrimidine deaminase / 5-amino-6-(5-phosphoribosylamino)uracil reductase
MARALELARAVKGRTSPNPAVGAVLVNSGRVVGEGATLPYGQLHAEPLALAQAGTHARGATLYVTLEPCSHQGRTPPCADAVIDAGVAAVVVATVDPNPRVAGEGIRRLREAGINVQIGDGAEEARTLNEDFARWITSGHPFVIVKFGVSLDGRIATHTGHSRWITGPPSRAEVHRLRDRVDAILVGVNTVLADDPELTTRLDAPSREPQHPWRLIVDSTCRTPPTARVLDPALPGRTTLFTTSAADASRRQAIERSGAEVCLLPSVDGRVDLPALLDEVGRRKVSSLLVEGGATVHGAFLDQGLVDFVMAFIAPIIIGGIGAPGAVGGRGTATLLEAPRLLDPTVHLMGADTLVSGHLRRAPWPPLE